ncbi:MAG: hypothetical protein RQ847_00735 [Wenzhouxiangellaceae bacterium]|nr:hypothetical protein [Wenzhouxiangellaceae bacterium]
MNKPIGSDNDRRWLDEPRNVDRVVHTLYAICAVTVLLDFVVQRHETLDFAHWFGFYAWYGFVACTGLVLAAKLLRVFVKRPEDYYERARRSRGERMKTER